MANETEQSVPVFTQEIATILIIQAMIFGETITYGEILDKLGIPETRGQHRRLSKELDTINGLCSKIDNDLVLSSIATKANGKPGTGLCEKWIPSMDVDAARAKVFDFDWNTAPFI